MKKNFFIIIITLFVISCNKPKDVIKREKFIEILAEIHIYDAILTKESLFDKNILTKDSVSFYNYLYKKYDISKKQFQENLEFYTSDIEDFQNIYAEVSANLNLKLANLDSLETTIEDIQIVDSLNLWNQKQNWNLPEDGENQTIKFSIEAHTQGTYVLSADIKIFEDDKTINPRITIYAYYKDGTYDSNETITGIKNGEFKDYTVSIITNKDKELDYLSGWILNHNQETEKKHIQVKNINLKLIEI